jgi:pilus assembly protein CpaD
MTFNILAQNHLKALALGFGMFGLVSCTTPTASNGPVSGWSNIEIAETVERLELYSQPNGLVLSARDETAVAQFLQAYGRFGDGPLYVNMPSGQTTGVGAQQTQQLIKRIMGNVGLGGAPMQSGQYQSAMGQPAPVVVSYRRLKTVPQDCRNTGNMSMTYNNQPYDGFGCSYHANLAAMIEDPRQLLEPYALTPPDMQRRMQVYGKYIEGESPASAQPDRQDISSGGSE